MAIRGMGSSVCVLALGIAWGTLAVGGPTATREARDPVDDDDAAAAAAAGLSSAVAVSSAAERGITAAPQGKPRGVGIGGAAAGAAAGAALWPATIAGSVLLLTSDPVRQLVPSVDLFAGDAATTCSACTCILCGTTGVVTAGVAAGGALAYALPFLGGLPDGVDAAERAGEGGVLGAVAGCGAFVAGNCLYGLAGSTIAPQLASSSGGAAESLADLATFLTLSMAAGAATGAVVNVLIGDPAPLPREDPPMRY